MCEFLSWIEHEGTLLYMDNKTLRDSYTRKIVRTARHNDVLGHGFIREVYDLTVHEGVEHENRDIWDTKRYPEEIREKLEAGEFSELWQYLQSDDLRYIIKEGPESYKEKAWSLYDKEYRSGLCAIVNSHAGKYSREAAATLLLEERALTSREAVTLYLCGYATKECFRSMLHSGILNYLVYVLDSDIAWYREQAWEKLLNVKDELSNTFEHLMLNVLLDSPEEYKKLAWEEIVKLNTKSSLLAVIIKDRPEMESYREEAVDLYIKHYNSMLTILRLGRLKPEWGDRARKAFKNK